MRRRLSRKIFPYNPKIESTLWKVRRGRVTIENQLQGGIYGLNQNMGKATRHGENNPQVLNPPWVNPPPQEANQQHQALRDYSVSPIIQTVIRAPPTQANQFKRKSIMLKLVHSIHIGGFPYEDPNTHILNFLEICSTVKYNGVTDDGVCLCLIPFSLKDKVKE